VTCIELSKQLFISLIYPKQLGAKLKKPSMEHSYDVVVFCGKLAMTIGKSFSMLKKSWRSYKLYRKDGYPTTDLAFRILKIQRSLSLPLSQFDELGDPAWVEEQLNNEFDEQEVYEGPGTGVELSALDIQLQKEERANALEDVGLVVDDYGNIEKDNEWS